MPRRGRSDKTAGDGEGPSSKRVKTEPTIIDGVVIQWEWEGDQGTWTGYNAKYADIITDSYNSGDSDVTFDVAPGTQMKILFEKSVQKNCKTGWERRLRCCVQDADSKDYFSWEWQDEQKRWNPYNAKTSINLEKALQAGEKNVLTEAYKRAYTINVAKMEQMNDDTDVTRPVQRIISTVIPPETPEETEGKEISSTIAAGAGDAGAKKGKSAASGARGKSAASGAKGKSTAARKSGAAAETKSSVRTVIVKGAAPVDPECTQMVGKAHVYSEGKNVWDCMLNQTNLQNNNNKYYLIQLLKEDNAKKYYVWLRWGRVGKAGQNNLFVCGPDLDDAKNTFCKKFTDKTKNEWSQRNKFVKVAGKYDMVALDYNVDGAAEDEDETDGPKKPVKVPDSKLDKKVQDLVNLICDIKSMEEAVVEMKYDAKKAPLGKLTPNQIKAGYAALKKIDDCISNNKMSQPLIQACDDFYTRIPHDFGMRPPTVIRTKVELKAKIQLLEALSDIEVAMTILKKNVKEENPMDTHYNMLDCLLEPMNKKDPMFKILEKYLGETHATTHQQYSMDIMEVFEVDKGQEAKHFDDRGNKMLLWHGSRLTNWMGILSQGLRIAPPEAPVTGYMFGKGIYFADMSSKSANYCYPTRAKNIALVLLCEVALGKCNELLAADYNADSLPQGKDSVWGRGKIGPNPKHSHVTPDGVHIPQSKGEDTGVNNPHGYTLNYNEFIVYSPNQVKMKYLLKVKFNFK